MPRGFSTNRRASSFVVNRRWLSLISFRFRKRKPTRVACQSQSLHLWFVRPTKPTGRQRVNQRQKMASVIGLITCLSAFVFSKGHLQPLQRFVAVRATFIVNDKSCFSHFHTFVVDHKLFAISCDGCQVRFPRFSCWPDFWSFSVDRKIRPLPPFLIPAFNQAIHR